MKVIIPRLQNITPEHDFSHSWRNENHFRKESYHAFLFHDGLNRCVVSRLDNI